MEGNQNNQQDNIFGGITDASAFADDQYGVPSLIKVIGVGGGGCNAVNYMYKQGIENVTFAVCNTDYQALRNSSVDTKILLGKEITKGLGAGDNPELGRDAAEASTEEIRQILDDKTEMVFITAGMGGGTGTGAGPVVAKVAKEAGMLTIGIVTIPFFFEGETKIYKALEGAEEMRKHVDSLLIINNERLTEIYKDLNFINAFSKADDTLANAARSIAEIINTEGYINVDFQDVKTTLKNSSTSIISTGYGEGDKRITKAINDALNSPLLKNSDIRSSKRLLFYLHFNPKAEKEFRMEEMTEISQFAANLSKNIKIKWGATFDETLGEKVKMTILASGFDITISDSGDTITFPGSEGFEEEPVAKPERTIKNNDERQRMLKDVYGSDKVASHIQSVASSKYIVLRPSQFDDDEVIFDMENNPAYNRDPRIREKIITETTTVDDQPLQEDIPTVDTTPTTPKPSSNEAGPTPIMFG